MLKRITLIGFCVVGVVFFLIYLFFGNYFSGLVSIQKSPSVKITEEIEKAAVNHTKYPLKFPDGYELTVFASGLAKPRDLLVDTKENILVSDIGSNSVYELPEKKLLISGLNKPHGLATYCDNTSCYLYIAEENKVTKYEYDPSKSHLSNPKKLFSVSPGGRHTTRSLLIKGDKLYISVGSSCNSCLESDYDRATVLTSDLDGKNLEVYASGLRNTVFMTLDPSNQEIWATEMGRDYLGDNVPPDEVNILAKNGFYGWPYCYGENIQDTSFDSSTTAKSICNSAKESKFDLQAHSAPLGLAFLNSKELLVAFHGSWNRSIPTGYKVVEINTETGKQTDFITGWLTESGEVLGRPVDILINKGDIYISDDKAGVVYRLVNL